MRLRVFATIAAMALLCAGCAAVTPVPGASPTPEVTVTPEISQTPSPTPEVVATPTDAPALGTGTDILRPRQEIAGADITLGMDLSEVISLLPGAALEETPNGYDGMASDVTGVLRSEGYTLGFIGDTLYYIFWTVTPDTGVEQLPAYIAGEITQRGVLPSYCGEENTDIFVFETEGGYFTQIHSRLDHNSVTARLSIADNSAAFPSDGRNVYFFGSGFPMLEEEGIGVEQALDLAQGVAAQAADGNEQTYACEGVALYKGEIYYSVRWAQLVDGHSSYNGQIYVSLSGETVWFGDFYSISETCLG